MSRKENNCQDLRSTMSRPSMFRKGLGGRGDSVWGKCRYRSRRGDAAGGIGGRKTKANATGELSHLYPCNALLTSVRTFARRPAVSRVLAPRSFPASFDKKRTQKTRKKSRSSSAAGSSGFLSVSQNCSRADSCAASTI
jgi:hypothetical protein